MACSERITTTYVPTARVRVEAAKDHDAEALNAVMQTYDADDAAYEEHDDGSRTWTLVVSRGARDALVEALGEIEGVEVEVVRS